MKLMKKKIIFMIMITIVVSSLLLLPKQVTGTFTAPVGTIYGYTVERARLNATINDEDYYCTGVSLESQGYNEGVAAEVTVKALVTDRIDYTISLDGGEEKEIAFFSNLIESTFEDYLIFIGGLAIDIIIDGNESFLLTEGIRLDDLVKTFFLPNISNQIMKTIEEVPKQFEEDISAVTHIYADYYKIRKYYEITENELIIEWLFTGQTIEDSIDFTFSNLLKIVYGIPQGELLGVKIIGEFDGVYIDMNLKLFTDYLIEKDGYDIGDIMITQTICILLPILVIGGGTTILGIAIISKRTKKNK